LTEIPSSDDLERDLSEARQMLRDLRANPGRPTDGEPVQGTGEAADGMVRVVAEGGKISKVELNPRVMRLASESLAEELAKAVNAALADLASKAVAEVSPLGDPAVLEAKLAELQDQSVRQMARYSQSLSEMLARLDR
jgi:hypothetical protein